MGKFWRQECKKKPSLEEKKLVYRINSGRSVLGGFADVLGRFGEVLGRFWGGFGKVWGGFGEVFGEVLGRFLEGFGDVFGRFLEGKTTITQQKNEKLYKNLFFLFFNIFIFF